MRRSSRSGKKGPIFDYSVAEDVGRELDFHVEMRARELVAEGWDPSAARREALRLFGDKKGVEMECRQITSSQDRMKARARQFDELWRDLRFAGRSLRKAPLFTAVAVLTLALGIGANTSIFSVVNGVLLKPLPYPEADRIVRIREVNPSGNAIPLVGYRTFQDWREGSRSFSELAAYRGGETTVLGGDRPLIRTAVGVTEEFFEIFRTGPVHGRGMLPEEFGANPAQVAVVSHRYWRNHLDGADFEGVRLEVYGFDLEVVGVIPAEFDFPNGTDVWFPLELFGMSPYRTGHNNLVIGRLAEGVSIESAHDEMNALAARLSEQYPDHRDAAASVVTLQSYTVAGTQRPLFLLLGAAGLVLLVACTNLASTLLARGEGRQRELAVRASVGAERGRIIRQLFTESLLLAALGCLAGLAVAWALVQVLLGLAPAGLPRIDAVGLDPLALAFAVLVSLATAVMFGLLPAFRISATRIGEALRAGDRGSSGGRSGRLWNLLVASEVALALVLLAGSGLLIKSFWEVLSVEPGFDPSDVLTVEVTLPGTRYAFGDPEVARFYTRFLQRIEALPGAEGAGLVSSLPLSGSDPDGAFEIEGRPGERCVDFPRGQFCIAGNASYRVVGGDYFEAMDIPLIRGRTFDERDHAEAPMVLLINETMARRFWGDEDPVGQRMRTGGMDNYGHVWTRIIGVVGDVRHDGLATEPQSEYYVNYLQRPDRAQSASVVVEASSDPELLVGPVGDQLRALDPEVPADFTPMGRLVRSSVSDRRFPMLVLSVFAALALLLAAVGIYGVVSYSVERRRRELGIRMALGARPRSVLMETLRWSLIIVLAGAVVGVVGALALTRIMRSLLFEVSPTDPGTLVGVLVVLLSVAVLASWVPARRGTRVDPLITMRSE